MTMKHYYCDKATPTRNWAQMLLNPVRVLFSASVFKTANASNEVVSHGIIIVHRSFFDEADFAKLPSVLNTYQELVVIVISGEPQSIPDGANHTRLHFRVTKVSTPDDSMFQRCALRFATHLEKDGCANPDFALLKPDKSYAHALRLLCEAWMFVDQKTVAKGISICAPTKLDDWLRPFGSNATTQSIAELMSDEKTAKAASNLLAAIENHRNPHVIRDAIKNFLKPVAGKPARR